MSGPRVFWKGLRLGDFRQEPETLQLEHKAPEVQSSINSESGHAHASGPSAHFELSVVVAMKRGYFSAESASQYWARVRKLASDLKKALVYGSGKPQFGPLSIIRDPDGKSFSTAGTTDQRDSTATTQSITGSGTAQAVNVGNVASTWAAGQYVLVFDPANPWTTYEIVLLTDANSTTHVITGVFTKTYPNASEVHRIEWYLPNAFLKNKVNVKGSGPATTNFRSGIEFDWGSNLDPVNGGLV